MKKSKLLSSTFVYFVAMLVLIVFYIIIDNVDLSYMSSQDKDIFTTLVIQVGIILLIPLVLYTFVRKQSLKHTLRDFNFSKISFKTVIYSFVIGIACYFINILVASFFSNIIALFGYESIPSYATSSGKITLEQLFINLVLVAVIPAICEEVAHRGLLLGGMSRLGLKRAVLLSSLLFGLLHLNINQFFYATVLGFLMAIAVIMSNSIYPAMIIHFCNNGISVYMTYERQEGLFGSEILSTFNNFLTGSNAFTAFIGSFAILTCLVGIVVLFYILLLKENRIKKMSNLISHISSMDVSKATQEKLSKINPRVNPFSNTYMQNLESLNMMYKEYDITNPQELIFKKEESEYHKPTLLEIVFLVGSIALAAIVTIFTFVWGIL